MPSAARIHSARLGAQIATRSPGSMPWAISARLMRSEKAQIMLNRVAALVFVGLAAKLATAHN